MRLTAYTDYSLRMLMHLAVNLDRPVTIEEIAKSYVISRAHLMKVAHQLGVMGYIVTTRGRHGGLRLSRSACEIGLADVVVRTEPDLALVPCLDSRNAECPIIAVCVLRRAVEKARTAFIDVLSGYTLADLIAPQSALKSLLASGADSSGRNRSQSPH